MDARELEADIIRGFDWIILASHGAQIKQNVFPRGHRGAGVASPLDEHLLELHEDVGVEVSEAQHGDHRGDRGRRRALLLEALLRDVERLGREGRELVVDHPARSGQRLRVDAQHIDGVLRVRRASQRHREALQMRRVEHRAALRAHEEVQRVEVRRHRQRAVHADVRVARTRHARQVAEALPSKRACGPTMSPESSTRRWRESLSSWRSMETAPTGSSTTPFYGAGGERGYVHRLAVEGDGLAQRGVVGLGGGLRHLRELPGELHARDEVRRVGAVAAGDGEQAALQGAVLHADRVVAKVAEDVVLDHEQGVRQRLFFQLLVADLQLDLRYHSERRLPRECPRNPQLRSRRRLPTRNR